jgi:lysylphosphatidylglycerol synthase-like protein
MERVDLPPVQAGRRRVPIELLSLLISAGLVVAGVALAYERIAWRQISGILLQLDGAWFIAALAAYWSLYPLNSLRFRYVTGWLRQAASTAGIPFMFAFRLTCGASFVALAAPMALVADVAKIGALRLIGNVSLTDATRYTLFDRVMAVQWMSVIGLLAIPAQVAFGFPFRTIGYQVGLFGAALAAIAVLIALPGWLALVPVKAVERFARLFAGYASLLTMRRTLVQFAIGALNLVLVFATLYFLLRAARLTADAWRLVTLVPFLQFINSLPFLYMGWGGREIAIAMTLGTVAGLSLNEALAISAAWGIILLLTSLINGAFLLGNWRGYRRV